MAITAAQLAVKVTADTKDAETGLSNVSKGVNAAGGLLKGLAIGAGVAGIAVAGAAVASVKMAGDFQSGITTLVTGAGEAQKNVKLVSDGILNLATQTGSTTKDLTDGLYEIESAGFHGAQGLSVLQAAAEGARVGNASLADVANGVTTEMTDYAKKGISASQATNILIATVANGKTHMQDLANAMSTILPTSAAVGVSLQDTSAALATMTGEGTDAASAATYLRQLLMALESPGSKAAATLKEIGLTSQQVSDGMKKSLPDTLKMITDALAKKFPVGSAAYVFALKDIAGGSKQMQGILQLTGDHLSALQTNLKLITGAAGGTKGAIQGWSLVQQDFNFKMDRAKEVVETLGIKIGTELLPPAEAIGGFIGDHLMPVITDLTNDIGPLITQAEGLGKQFDSATAKGSPVTASLTKMSATVKTDVLPGVTKFAQFLAANVIPVLVKLGTFILTKVVPAIVQLAAWFSQHVLPVLQVLVQVIIQNVLPTLESVAGTILSKLLPAVENLIGKILPILIPAFRLIGWVLQNVVGPALNFVINIVSGFITLIANLIGKLGDFLGLLGKVKDAVGNGLGAAGKAIGGILPHFAEGGTMASTGYALVGERGPEVVKLPGGSEVTPIGGGRGSSSSGGSQPVYLQIDGRTFARLILPSVANQIRSGAALNGV